MSRKPQSRAYRRLSSNVLDKRLERAEKAVKLAALDSTLDRVERGYQGAGKNRRWSRNWTIPSGNPDEIFLEDRQELQDKAGDLFRNSAIVRGAVNNVCDNAIGYGLRLQSTIDRSFLGLADEEAEAFEETIERKFHSWAQSVECDAARRLNFYENQQLAFRSYQVEGETFALMPRFSRNKGDSRLRVQLIAARRCSSPYFAGAFNSESHRDGIDFSDRGEPEQYWFQKTEGFFNGIADFVKIPAFGTRSGRRNVLHIFRPDFIGQSRGTPFVATVIEDIKQMDRYSKAELANAAVQALFTGFVKSDRSDVLDAPFANTTEESSEDRVQDMILDSGALWHLNPGEDVTFANPTRPASGFSAFMETYLMLIGMAANIPYEILVKRFNSSYTASKAARIEAWRHYTLERKRFVSQFCAPIFREWLIEAVATGEIILPGFFDSPDVMEAFISHEWFGDNQGQIDPTKETQAAIMRIGSGLSTHQIEAAAIGHDFEKNIRMIKREKKLLEDAGVQLEMFTPPPGEQQQEQQNDRY